MVFGTSLLEHEIDDIIVSFVCYLESVEWCKLDMTTSTAIASVYCEMEDVFLDLLEPVAGFAADICPILYHTFILYVLETRPRVQLTYGTTTPDDKLLSPDQIAAITQKIAKLKSIPQPTQRTPEWYIRRYDLITASNAYKALGTQAAQNSLIYEKCKPLAEFDADADITLVPTPDNPFSEFKRMINTNLPTHWGQRYEPLSVAIYEMINRTHIADFGCIPHEQYPFLGASPDGINDDPTSPLFGRMLEIKNVVSREITGVPKPEYAVQMQMQMEVCDLDTCDFLETKFVEFDHKPDFYDSIANADELITVQGNTIPAFHGVILQFQNADSVNPTYVPYIWNPVAHNDEVELPHVAIPLWEKHTICDTLAAADTNIYGHKLVRFVQIHYWKLDVYSCALIHRDREWFINNVPKFQSLWETVLKERVEGYEHRAPKKRAFVDVNSKPITDYPGFSLSTDNVKTITVDMSEHATTTTAPTFRNSRKSNTYNDDKYNVCMF